MPSEPGQSGPFAEAEREPLLTVSWFDDVEDAVGRVRAHGGAVHAEQMDVPNVGRFVIVADQQHGGRVTAGGVGTTQGEASEPRVAVDVLFEIAKH